MSKYLCIVCGQDFKTKEISDLHAQVCERHIIVKMSWFARFCNWFFNFNLGRFLRFSGLLMVYFVFIHHFDIHWNWWEAIIIGLGLGMYVE